MQNITCPFRTKDVKYKNTSIINLTLVTDINKRNYHKSCNPIFEYTIYFNTSNKAVEWYYETEAQRDEVYDILLAWYSSPVAKPIVYNPYYNTPLT